MRTNEEDLIIWFLQNNCDFVVSYSIFQLFKSLKNGVMKRFLHLKFKIDSNWFLPQEKVD